MVLIVFVEGDTEDKILSKFLHKWLDKKLPEKLLIKTVNFKGYANFYKDAALKASMYLNGPRSKELVAVIGLLDLYGPTFFPEGMQSVKEKYQWGKEHLEEKVGLPRFKQHFAVHELEAWLLSDPSIFTAAVAAGLKKATEAPEEVNSNKPPAKYLNHLYLETTERTYKKVTEGNRLFAKIDPETVREKCPYFKKLTDDIYQLTLDYIDSNHKLQDAEVYD
jgi:hypothetical protein